jgi:hypothetical protein
MTAQCCTGEGPSRRLARRLSGAAASILPGAVLVLLPKCPLCLAAWFTVVTGIALPAATAARVRGLIVVFWAAAVALAATQIVRRRANLNRGPGSRGRGSGSWALRAAGDSRDRIVKRGLANSTSTLLYFYAQC